MKESKISIITASYNYAEYIEQTIESVIYQTYKNWEYIIIDDGSTDNSVELIKNYTKNYDNIHLYEHADSQNKGLKQTLLLGLEKATGEYIAFLESDDFWELNYLEEKVKLLNIRPQPKLIYNLVNFVGDKQVIQEKNYTNTTEDACKEEFTYKNVAIDMLNNPIIPSFSSVFVEKNALENCDFNTPLDAFLDWWIWTQIACKYKILHINKKLTNFRAPDKYNVYYDYIEFKKHPRNTFFSKIRPLPKRYNFIDTKFILEEAIKKGQKDIYHVDDTHWSYKASEIIAENIILK